MRVAGRHYRSIWRAGRNEPLCIIDQTRLPHHFDVVTLADLEAAAVAIETMQVRGAPLIGATAAHGLALSLERSADDSSLEEAAGRLRATRPTAVNLAWAVDRILDRVRPLAPDCRAPAALEEAIRISDEDVLACESIGRTGSLLLEELVHERARRGSPVTHEMPLQILTHCNAGWLAAVDWGTALAPIYKAHEDGLPLHVWVDETRPRNQGASLTAFELREMGIPHTVIVDNAGGHLMQHGQVDAVIVGSDRTTASGDVCNKIGTYLKALAAHDNGVPFYVTLPTSTIDWSLTDGLESIPIEERHLDEVRFITGLTDDGEVGRIELFSPGSPAANPAFDVTPARLVTALVTELGVFDASIDGLASIAPMSGDSNAADG